jgi:hypothetical protein
MSAAGHSRRFGRLPTTSGIPRLADILRVGRYVSKVPLSEVLRLHSFDRLIRGQEFIIYLKVTKAFSAG